MLRLKNIAYLFGYVTFDFMKINISFKSDAEGMFGRQCQNTKCKKYFKVKAEDYLGFGGDRFSCPYCGATGHPNLFITEDQLNYAKSVAAQQVLQPFLKQLKNIEKEHEIGAFISLGIKVDVREPVIRQYFEKQSRRTITCEKCQGTYSVYGVSFYCPFCGPREPFAVFNENMDAIKRSLNIENVLNEDKHLVQTGVILKLHEEGFFDILSEKMLDAIITSFETYCKNKYADKMARLHPLSSYQEWLKKAGNKFQNLDRAEQLLQDDLGFSIEEKLLDTEKKTLLKALQKRHVFVHNSGIIDETYVKATQESYSFIGKKVTVEKREMEELLSIICKLVHSIEETFRG
jgi:sarcosine oxidase delta subunit